MALIGSVKIWKPEKGFGFVVAEDGTELFAHVQGVADGMLPCVGDKVAFDIEESKLKPGNYQACNISGGTGGDVTAAKGKSKGGWPGNPNVPHVPTGQFSGQVKSFVFGKGYGFIIGPDGVDIFVHTRNIVDGRDLKQGDTVTYDLDESKAEPGKMIAVNVAGGTGWPQGKDGGKGGKGKDSWGDGWGDSWGWDGGYGAAKGEGKGKGGPYGGKGKLMEMLSGVLSAFDGWGDDGWGWDSWGGDGKGKGKGKESWGGDGGKGAWGGDGGKGAWGGDGGKGKAGKSSGKGDSWGTWTKGEDKISDNGLSGDGGIWE